MFSRSHIPTSELLHQTTNGFSRRLLMIAQKCFVEIRQQKLQNIFRRIFHELTNYWLIWFFGDRLMIIASGGR